MINRVSFFVLSLVLLLTISLSQAQTPEIDSLRQKAEQGDAKAQLNLGRAYSLGEGVPQDYVQAHMWLNLAASKLKGEDRDTVLKLRDLAAEKMTWEQLSEAQRLAREWAEKHRQ